MYWLNDPLIFPEQIKVPSARQEKYGDKRAKKGGRLPDNINTVEIDPQSPAWKFSRVCGTLRKNDTSTSARFPNRSAASYPRPLEAGDTVFDPFSGSGTTCYQVENRRNFIGMDCCQSYDKTIEEVSNRIKDGRIK